MEIRGISAVSVQPVADAAGRAAEPRPQVRQAREAVPPPGLIGSNTMVEFGRHEGTGAEVVKFVDKRTGEVINQMPAEQVLDAVTNLMRLVQKRES